MEAVSQEKQSKEDNKSAALQTMVRNSKFIYWVTLINCHLLTWFGGGCYGPVSICDG